MPTKIKFKHSRKVRIGILTDGTPQISAPDHRIHTDHQITRYIPLHDKARAFLSNQLIGYGFHWQKTVGTYLPGELELTVGNGNQGCMLVNILDIEDYLARVVGSEMNPASPPELLKAHAIISRSWVAGKINGCHVYESKGRILTGNTVIDWEDTDDHDFFDVCSDDHCQRYQGDQSVSTEALSAISATAGLVLTDPDGGIVDTRFSKCCGGRTELFGTCWQDIDPQCLRSVECPYCALPGMSTASRRAFLAGVVKDYDMGAAAATGWSVRIMPSTVERRLAELCGINSGTVEDIKVTRRGISRRASLIEIKASNGVWTIGKELLIRRVLSDNCLFSSMFDIKKENDGSFTATGRGWGHGVGLCQIGAANMARLGADAPEILNYYYPESAISRIQ